MLAFVLQCADNIQALVIDPEELHWFYYPVHLLKTNAKKDKYIRITHYITIVKWVQQV